MSLIVLFKHSWKWFVYHRCHNVNRPKSTDVPAKKRRQNAAHFHPPVNSDDDVSFQRNLGLLADEMKWARPHVHILKELMRCTFPNRYADLTIINLL